MLIKTMLDQRGPITRGEVELLEIAEKMPIVFDKDNPELTKEDLKGFHPKGKLGRGLAQVRLVRSPSSRRSFSKKNEFPA